MTEKRGTIDDRNVGNIPEDGGRAFPSGYTLGMSYREWLEGLAMQGICSNSVSGHLDPKDISKFSKEIADAMIKKGKEND